MCRDCITKLKLKEKPVVKFCIVVFSGLWADCMSHDQGWVITQLNVHRTPKVKGLVVKVLVVNVLQVNAHTNQSANSLGALLS